MPLRFVNNLKILSIFSLCYFIVNVDWIIAVDNKITIGSRCNSDDNSKDRTPTDLLICMNELARGSTNFYDIEGNQEGGRSFGSWGAYPQTPSYQSSMSNGQFFNELLWILSRRFRMPLVSNLLGIMGFFRPGQSFYNAMSSIAHYDDYKCVSRILCEVATGTMPGNYLGRQNNDLPLQGYGQNPLFGFLTSLDARSSSPFVIFGKAAVIGFSNRNEPRICYQEYPKCPRESGDLIWYLNNHKGGFFRFFNSMNHNGNYYHKPQQSNHQSYI